MKTGLKTSQNKAAKALKIFLIAGEASGDVLGGKLIESFKKLHPSANFAGIGGSHMEKSGMKMAFNYKDIALMGFAEVLPKLFKILHRMGQAIAAIKAYEPDILVTIDSPGFNFRVVSKVRKFFGKKFPIIHYVAPTVWAYKKERAGLVAKLYDHILLLLPFEKPYFDEAGIDSTFVGHPITEDTKLDSSPSLPKKAEVINILIMPGSRVQEINHMGKIFADSLNLLQTKHNLKVKALIPTLPFLEGKIQEIFSNVDAEITTDPDKKVSFFAKSHLALVKSGTSSLEVASYGIPCVVGYKMSSITYWYLKRIVYAKYISLVNLLLGAPVIPELIQQNCTPENIASELYKLLDVTKYQKMQSQFQKSFKLLDTGSTHNPSELAAQAILKCYEGKLTAK
ncbi:MAG: lipid-A-disaccharide synthase [Candidatus Midichloriaceae bacterium]|jgi:lipid-A-disaccharide synthase|nr:lipid-A-disaccharide synthase [Candidatus Midichloriaceae bacterium]